MAVQAILAKQREATRKKIEIELQKRKEAEARRKKEIADIENEQKKVQAWTELQQALRSGDDKVAAKSAKTVKSELFSIATEDGTTPLHAAAASGLLECCETMLKRKDFPLEVLIARDRRGWTPLHCAAASVGNGCEVCTLIASQEACQVDLCDHEGRTAIQVAVEWGLAEGKVAITNALSAKLAKARSKAKAKKAANGKGGADSQLDGLEEPQALDVGPAVCFSLCREGRFEECRQIVTSVWPFINQIDHDRHRNLLHYAAAKGQAVLCESILARGDFQGTDQMDLDRATALHLAAAGRHVECCIAIVASSRCFGVNLQDMRDQSPLHLAALRGDAECYNAILAHEDVDLTLKDFRGRTAPDYAIERGLDVEIPRCEPTADSESDMDEPSVDDSDIEVNL